jgi:hypothetical protein
MDLHHGAVLVSIPTYAAAATGITNDQTKRKPTSKSNANKRNTQAPKVCFLLAVMNEYHEDAVIGGARVEGMRNGGIMTHSFHVGLIPRSRFHSVVEKSAECGKHMM